MSNELQVRKEALKSEVTWMAKMATDTPEASVIQVTALLGALALRRVNGEHCQETVLPVTGTAKASISVDAAKLATALRTVDGTLNIAIDNDQLVIKSSQRTVRLKASEVVLPKWPRFVASSPRATLTASQLARVLTSVGTDDTLPSFTRVAFSKGLMIATDRFRMSLIKYGFHNLVEIANGSF